jgi:hypothetical protein
MVKARIRKLAFLSVAATAAAVLFVKLTTFHPASHPFPGITYFEETTSDPPLHSYWLKVDLTNKAIHFRVCPGGARPGGAGQWETVLNPVSTIARRYGLDIAINGSLFAPKGAETIFGHRLPYFVGNWAMAGGWTVTDGTAWSSPPFSEGIPTLVIRRDGKVSIDFLTAPPKDAWQAVSGNWLLRDGHISGSDDGLAARTAVGLDASNQTMIIYICDGRRRNDSVGLSMAHTAQKMIDLGCRNAINLDSGGSTTLVMRHGGTYSLLNRPSDAIAGLAEIVGCDVPIPWSMERPVANALGITVDENSAR